MSRRWDSLRSKFQAKDVDLDAEFERFLNESMSDESVSSPRHKNPPLKNIWSKGSQDDNSSTLPWWAEEDEEEEKRDAVRQSWLKPKPKEDKDAEKTHVDKPAIEKEELDEHVMDMKGSASLPASTSLTLLSTDSHHDNTALSMSKDSLNEGVRQSWQKDEPIQEETGRTRVPLSVPTEEFEENQTYSGEIGTGRTASTTSPNHIMSPPDVPPQGLDTLKEQAEKNKFFEDEEKGGEVVDYHRKLLQMSESKSKDGGADMLQATGVEVGDSIFNITDETKGRLVDRPTGDYYQQDDEYSEHFEETRTQDEKTETQEDEEITDQNIKDESLKPAGLMPVDPNKPSMLSKVSLMDSLESTLDVRRPPPKRSPTEQQGELDIGTGGKEAGSGTGYLYSGNTDTIAELQAALRQAQLNATEGSDRYTGKFDLPATPTVIQGINENTRPDGQMVIEKASDGETHSRGFNLQPVIVTDSAPVEKELKQPSFKTQFGSAGFTLTSDSVDSASIPMDCRGFNLQSVGQLETGTDSKVSGFAVDSRGVLQEVPRGSLEISGGEGRGFSLQPVAQIMSSQDIDQGNEEEEEDGVDDEYLDEEDMDEDTPPPDSLRSIKAKVKARQSVDAAKRSTEKKHVPGKKMSQKDQREDGLVLRRGVKGSVGNKVVLGQQKERGKGKGSSGRSLDRSRIDEWQPSLSSPPLWSPTPTTRKSKQKDKKLSSSKTRLKPGNSHKEQQDSSPSQQHLAASVESFANYLKHLVRPEDQENQPPTPRWSDDEPAKSRTSLRSMSGDGRLDRLSRERGLQDEVENWQLAWKDERRRNDKLIDDMAAREREWTRKGETTRLAYGQQMEDLKQEMYTLKARLQEEQQNADNRKRVAAGGNLKGVSEIEKKRLEKEIREQEELLKGYQQENERLYRDLKQIQAKGKTTEGRMFAENQKLATEVANLKEKLDQRGGGIVSHYSTPGSAILGADKINQLQDQIGSAKRRESKLQSELDDVRLVNTRLEYRLRETEKERDDAIERSNQALGTTKHEREELEVRHDAEVERLTRKVKWYVENQEMLDRDIVAMKMKNQEISELKETVKRQQAQQGKAVTEKRQRNAERTSDAKRIQDLERQVREMEEIIKRRYPNSLPALIFAAGSAPGFAQPATDESPKKQSPSYVFLENRVKKLEAQLEEKDDEASRRIRAIEQMYNSMKFDYEERIKGMERDLKKANEKPKPSTHPHTHAQALEKELAAVREGDRRRIAELESEVSVLQEALGKVASLQAHSVGKNKKRKSEEKRSTMPDPKYTEDISAKLLVLQGQLTEKDEEIYQLKQTCSKLQHEREHLLSQKDSQSSAKVPSTPPRTVQLDQDNEMLKRRLAELSLNIDQDRVRYQASLAEAERMTRQARDDAADQLEREKAQYQREINQLKADFAVRHSTSKVTELQSRIASQEIIIQRLKDKLAVSAINVDALSAAKVREETLKQQMAHLREDLGKAKENFTPEMRHFDSLQSKIAAMELRFDQRESDLDRIISTAQIKSRIEKEESDSRWRQVVRTKNQEIERFREELDMILEALRELRRQGVMVPIIGSGQHLMS